MLQRIEIAIRSFFVPKIIEKSGKYWKFYIVWLEGNARVCVCVLLILNHGEVDES